MKHLRGMADNKRYTIWSLDVCLKFLETLENITSTAFGPEGSAVMVQQPTGQLTIFRSGHSIISSAFAVSQDKHPVLQMLLKHVECVHKSLGDGVKTFIIMIAALLRYSKTVENKVLFMRHLNAFQACINELTPNTAPVEQPQVNSNALSFREVYFRILIDTFFSTRFSEPVKCVLSPLMCKWILSYSNGCEQPYSSNTLKMLLQYFAFLCEYKDNTGRPVMESTVQPGFRIAHSVVNLLHPGLKKLKFLMLEDGDKPESGLFSAIDVDSEVSRLLLSADGEETLLITSAMLSDLALFRLKCLHIAVLHGLQHEDVNFIYSTVCHNRAYKMEDAVIDVKLVVENGKVYTHLGTLDTFQLHICGPTAELTTEYAKECYNALKLLVHSSSCTVPDTGIPHVVEAGGIFEESLSIKFLSMLDKNKCLPLLLGIRSRAELLAKHKKLQKLSCKRYTSENDSKCDKNVSHFMSLKKQDELSEMVCNSVCGGGSGVGGGSTTVMVPVIDFNKNLKQKDLLLLPSSALLCCCTKSESCTIVNQLIEKCSEMDVSLLAGIANALQAVQRKLPTKVKAQCLEPLALKLGILRHVVNVVVSLLRIDEN